MTTFIQVDHPLQHPGVQRMEHAAATWRGLARKAGQGWAAWLAGWRAARQQAAEDRKMWDIALQDARVMADLSRATSRAALDGARRLA